MAADGGQNDTVANSMSTERFKDISEHSIRCLDLCNSYRQCVSSFYQFHHYYIYGKFSDCKEEKERMKNCFKWKMKKSEEAKTKLLTSLQEIEDAKNWQNPLWKRRERPPDDW